MIFGLEFPPIENLVEWPNWFGPEGSWYGFNKIAFISLVAIVATSVLFILGNRKRSMVPKGAQNLVESSVAFIRDGIVLETMGPDGMRYLPYLVSLFFFILVGNIFEVIPFFHMPANARMAGPAVLALITWAYYIAVGLKHQGPKYFINAIAPPGVPKALYILVVPIEFLSTFIVRPFSLAVRLFANMLAGHILLVTFSVLCITLFTASLLALVLPLSFFMLVALTGFEVMVAFLQAYIFTILAAVYIGSSMHAEH
ncbi:MAG: F0F1 ATP synthase subunit A [Acidimicrobiia bacterium]|nr:F0F1 ATP synthase subunit A [Acidimicrobiia bacterium]